MREQLIWGRGSLVPGSTRDNGGLAGKLEAGEVRHGCGGVKGD